MPLSDKQKKIVLASAAAGVVLGGAVLYLKSRSGKKGGKQHDEDDMFTAADSAKTSVAVPVPSSQESSSGGGAMLTSELTRDYSFKDVPTEAPAATVSAPRESSPTPTRITTTVRAPTSLTPNSRQEMVPFKEFFCAVRPSVGWTAAADPAPMPNIGMIQFKRPEFDNVPDNAPPGSVPAILLTIEDVSNENMSVIELKEKSKQMAFQQMAMLSQGAMRPNVLYDDKLAVGPFEHCLEYAQQIPPFMDMRINNLITIKNGLAYCFQFLASPEVYLAYKPSFMDMARAVIIEEDTSPAALDFTNGAHVVNTLNGVRVLTPAAWTVISPSVAGTRVAEFKTSSETKTEAVAVYKGDALPPTVADFTKVGASRTVQGVEISVLKDKSGKERRVAVYNAGSDAAVTVVVTPLKISKVELSDLILAALAKSVVSTTTTTGASSSTSSSSSPLQRLFRNPQDGYEMPIDATNGSLLSSKIGCGTTIYAPAGVEAMHAGVEAPTCTIRVGNPSNDKSCAASLAEWRLRLSGEEGVSNIENTTLAGSEAIHFTTTEMTEVGPGMRSETKSKVVITVRGENTLLLRWEAPSGIWRKYERHLNEIIAEFAFM